MNMRLGSVLRLVVAGVTAAVVGRLEAGTVSLKPVADTGILAFSPNNNFGAGTALVLGGINKSPMPGRILLQFDIAAGVPAGARVTAATLKIQVTKKNASGPDTPAKVFRLNTAWTEGKKAGQQGAAAAAGESNWKVTGVSGVSWASPGGGAADFAADPSASAILKGVGSYSFTSAKLAEDVEAWRANPASNRGWILLADNELTGRSARRVGSRESGASSPVLELVYEEEPVISAPALSIAAVPAGYELRFPAPAGNLYSLQGREDAGGGAWTTLTNVAAKFESLNPVIVDPAGGLVRRFYRLLIQEID